MADFFEFSPKEKFDLVFSHGVIEHFADYKTRVEAVKTHARLSKRYVAIFVPKESFLVRTFFHLPEERGFEKLYTFVELEGEIIEAGLKPLKKAQDLHVLGILASI